MATLISSTAGNTGGPNTVTTTGIDTTGANLLVVGLALDDAASATVSDSKGNTWTQLISYTQGNVRVRLYYSIPASVGTAHAFTVTGSSIFASIYVQAFSGVSAVGAVDKQSGSNGFVAALQPGSITPGQNNELIVTLLGINAAGAPMSIDSGFTETNELDFVGSASYGGAMAYLVQTTAAAVNPTWTRTNTNGTAATQASFVSQTIAGRGFFKYQAVKRSNYY